MMGWSRVLLASVATGDGWFNPAWREVGALSGELVRGSRRTLIRRLAMGAASEGLRPEALISQAARASSDFAGVVPLGGGRIALILGDVCSGDLAATRCVPQILSALRLVLNGHAHPAHALGALNRALCGADLPASCRPVLLSLAVMDVGTGEALCACAGSEPPLILRAGGSIEAVNAGVMGLGVDAGWAYRAVGFLLREGDALLLATDGITGARRAGGEVGEALGCEGLVASGVPRDQALMYQERLQAGEFQAGEFLVVVHGGAGEAMRAHEILEGTSPAHLQAHVAAPQGSGTSAISGTTLS